MYKESSDPVEEEEIIEVDVEEDSEDAFLTEEIEIDPEEVERKRIEDEIIKLIDKGKINPLVKKYQKISKSLASEIKLKEEYLHTAQLVQAEFENYKKRVHKDQEVANYRNKANILQKFFTIYEDIERTHLQNTKETDIKTASEAFKLIFRNIKDIFTDLGIKIINPQDEIFDPKHHEVLYTLDNKELPDNRIIEVVEKGFLLDSIVLKPARVIISKVPKNIENGNND